MKTTTNSKQGFFKFLSILKQATPLVIALAMCSCASTGQVSSTKNPEKTPLVSIPSGWYQVKKNPLTFFPRGLSANSSTGMEHGEWVYAGANGERWFIPDDGVNGTSAEALYIQAFAMRTADQIAGRQKFLEEERQKVAARNSNTRALGDSALEVLDVARKTAITAAVLPGMMIPYSGDTVFSGIGDLWAE